MVGAGAARDYTGAAGLILSENFYQMNTKEKINKKKKFERFLYMGLWLIVAGEIIEWHFDFPFVVLAGMIVSIYASYLRYVYDL